MKNVKSILGGHYADLLLNTVSINPLGYAEAQFHGLECSLRERRYSGSKERTGGLLLSVRQIQSDPTYSKRGRWVYALRPGQRINARDLLCRKITLIIREWHNERQRQAAVAEMDKLCVPILASKKAKQFTKWVDWHEALGFATDYDKLSVEEANAWSEAILDWKRNPRTARVAIIVPTSTN